MDAANRRNFLKIAGVGAAAVGTAALTTSVAGSAQISGAASVGTTGQSLDSLPAGATGSMVAYVGNVRNGEISLMVEGREFTVTDHQLVARLATALHTARATAEV